MSEKYTNEKYVVTWDMFHMHARKLAERLLPASQWKGIIAVSRGGLFPAAVLARELSIRHVETVCISSYDHNEQGELKVLHAAQTDGEGFIVVDDYVIDIPQETWIEQPWDLGITFVPPLARK